MHSTDTKASASNFMPKAGAWPASPPGSSPIPKVNHAFSSKPLARAGSISAQFLPHFCAIKRVALCSGCTAETKIGPKPVRFAGVLFEKVSARAELSRRWLPGGSAPKLKTAPVLECQVVQKRCSFAAQRRSGTKTGPFPVRYRGRFPVPGRSGRGRGDAPGKTERR